MNRPSLSRGRRITLTAAGLLALVGIIGYLQAQIDSTTLKNGLDELAKNWHIWLIAIGSLVGLASLLQHLRYTIATSWSGCLNLVQRTAKFARRSRTAATLATAAIASILLASLVDQSDRLEVLKSFVWPGAILIIILLFRTPFTNLINQIDQAEGWGVRISRQADDVRQMSESIPPQAFTTEQESSADAEAAQGGEEGSNGRKGPGDPEDLHDGYEKANEDYFRLNPDETDPALVILARWEGVRQHARNLAEDFPAAFRRNRRGLPFDPVAVMHILATYGIAPDELIKVVASLRHIRNEIAHARRVPIDASAALSYDVAARKVAEAFGRARLQLPSIVYERAAIEAIERVGGIVESSDSRRESDPGNDAIVSIEGRLVNVAIKWRSSGPLNASEIARTLNKLRNSGPNSGQLLITNSSTEAQDATAGPLAALEIAVWRNKNDDADLKEALLRSSR